MKKLILSLGVALLALCGCKETSSVKEREDRIVVDITQPEKNLKMSDLFSDIKYVKLETTSESLIQYINRVVDLEGNLLVVDRDNQSLLLFDKDGRFIKKIAGQGKGPGEYSKMYDAAIDKEGRRLFVLDAYAQSVLIYDFDGKCLDSKKFGFWAHELEYIGGDKVALYSGYAIHSDYVKENAQPTFFVFDLKDGTITPFQYINNEIKPSEVASPASALASSGNGRTYCLNDLTHEIDVMNEEGLERTLTLDFGEEDTERRMAFVKLLEEKNNDFQSFGAQRHVSVFSMVGTDNYLLVSAVEPRNEDGQARLLIAYSPESGKCIYGKKKWNEPLDYDIDGSIPFLHISGDGDKLYGYVMPERLLSSESDSEILKQLKEGLLEDDNPILVIATTKPL